MYTKVHASFTFPQNFAQIICFPQYLVALEGTIQFSVRSARRHTGTGTRLILERHTERGGFTTAVCVHEGVLIQRVFAVECLAALVALKVLDLCVNSRVALHHEIRRKRLSTDL
jgi:hypothetical protein